MISKFRSKLPITSFVICVLLVISLVIIRNFDSTQGREFDKLKTRLEGVEVENSILQQKVASASSILTISQKAEGIGFTSTKSVVSLYVPQPIARAGSTL